MNLKQYVEKHKSTATGLASKFGVAASTVRNIIAGKDFLLSIAFKIEEATEGEVSLQDLAKALEKNKKNAGTKNKKQSSN